MTEIAFKRNPLRLAMDSGEAFMLDYGVPDNTGQINWQPGTLIYLDELPELIKALATRSKRYWLGKRVVVNSASPSGYTGKAGIVTDHFIDEEGGIKLQIEGANWQWHFDANEVEVLR